VFEARAYNVLIASPGDTRDARDAVEQAIQSWNRDRSRYEKVILLSLRWEVDAIPEMGNDAQAIINRQLAAEADIVIGLFHSRIGLPTPRSRSGSVEEIEDAADRGAKVHVYFSDMPHPPGVDTEHLTTLRGFRASLQERGLVGTYASIDDLVAKVRTALERDVSELTPPESFTPVPLGSENVGRAVITGSDDPHVLFTGPAISAGAILRTQYDSERLVIQNLGHAAAEDVQVIIDPIGEGSAPELLVEQPFESLPPQGSISVPLAIHMGVAGQWRVTLSWREDSTHFEEIQTVIGF
jgi:hypothetical protein